jgi:hypothetical protein
VHCGRQFLIGALAPEVHEFHLTQRLNRLLRKSGKQIPRGLKPARDDKNKKSLAARPSAGSGQALKVRTFKNEGLIVSG